MGNGKVMTYTIDYHGRRITGEVWCTGDRWEASENEIRCIELPCGRKLESEWLIISWLAKAGPDHRRAIEIALAEEAVEYERRQRWAVNYEEYWA